MIPEVSSRWAWQQEKLRPGERELDRPPLLWGARARRLWMFQPGGRGAPLL